LIKNDTAFKWYATNQKSYSKPDSAIVAVLKKDSAVKYIVFGGTWCDDTRVILPKFFLLQEKAGIADSRITFFGVDRKKETIGNIASAMNITNVPTIIVMKNGKFINITPVLLKKYFSSLGYMCCIFTFGAPMKGYHYDITFFFQFSDACCRCCIIVHLNTTFIRCKSSHAYFNIPYSNNGCWILL
jgi:thiol-disulfide isomerase/thioredoxin